MQYRSLASSILLLLPAVVATPSSLSYSAAPKLTQRDGGMTDCNGGGLYGGKYSDNQGSYVTSDSVSHPYRFPRVRKCWQDYFVVDQSLWDQPWRKSSGDTYCTGTPNCMVASLTGTQVCQTRSTSISFEVSGAITKAVSVGVSVSFELSDQNCYSASSTTTCTWNDAQCHCVWTQQKMLKQQGYMRKRCDWGNGDETQCMTDWEVNTPTTGVNYGCGSKCTDTNLCGHTDGTPCP